MKKIFDTNIILNKLMVVSILSLVLILISSETNAKGTWGSKPLLEKNRPNRNWINLFPKTANVIANDSISKAIESCDDIVGKGKYCVVEIGNSAKDLPVEIFRSRTKLIGIPNMRPLRSTQNGIFIYIGDKTQQVIVEGLDIQGHHAGIDEIYGIILEGESIKNILIRNNKIHDFDSDSDAHGIAVYGTGKKYHTGIRNIIIEGNEVFSMRTGSSESIVVNGNVRHWEIKNNDIYDVNNIAIDAIGGEGTSSARQTKKRGKRILPGHLDAASFGFIEDNYVKNMSTLDNPAYDNKESWAAAIYIDGGHHIKVTDNVVVNASWGYEIGAENCLTTRHISMTGNSANGSTFGDLLLGGYAETGFRTDPTINCNPDNSKDENEGHGYVSNITVKDNQFKSTGTALDPVTLQFRTTHAIIAEPSVTPVNEEGNGVARGDENAVRSVE